MQVKLMDISGVQVFEGTSFSDSRGTSKKLLELGTKNKSQHQFNLNSILVVHNPSKGTLRGLHFQAAPFAEEKVISCLEGEIYDVVVDLRNDSPSKCNWAAITLSGDKPQSVFLPKGLAHGYQTLSNNSTVVYAISTEYSPENSWSLNYASEDLAISWPLKAINLSSRDLDGETLYDSLKLASRDN
jgi:dTDP-4-dehydrorhamnose 3,5-epimerase